MVSLEELKQKIEDADKQLTDGRKNKSISLKKADGLYFDIEKAFEGFKKDDLEPRMIEDFAWVFIKFIWVNSNFVQKWKGEKSHPTEEEFNIIKKYSDSLQKWVDDIRKTFPSFIEDSLYQDLKEEIKEIEDFVQQEEKYQKSPSNNDDNNDRNGPNNSDDAKKITNLQNQINQLEAELRNRPNSETSQQDKEELTRLKTELEKLKEKKDGNPAPTQKNKNNFPTGLVVGGGVVIVILLLVVIVLVGKNSKRQNY